MTEPAWNGRGTDPWLPYRLDGVARVGQHERAIRRGIWSALSSWLVGAARRVLRGDTLPPDLDVIWAMAPTWREAVDNVIKGEIREAMGAAYRPLFGQDYPWDARPAVAQHLAEVRNRLVRVPDEVYDLAAQEVQQGVASGAGVPAIAERVDNLLSITASERWPNRATVIARTEAVGALNAGRNDAFKLAEEQAGTDLVKVWLATEDSRTRLSHQEADGQRVAMGANFTVGGVSLAFPGDPDGPPQEVIQCRCTMLLMEPDEDVDLSDRQLRRL
jgi:hypothetical protein